MPPRDISYTTKYTLTVWCSVLGAVLKCVLFIFRYQVQVLSAGNQSTKQAEETDQLISEHTWPSQQPTGQPVRLIYCARPGSMCEHPNSPYCRNPTLTDLPCLTRLLQSHLTLPDVCPRPCLHTTTFASCPQHCLPTPICSSLQQITGLPAH